MYVYDVFIVNCNDKCYRKNFFVKDEFQFYCSERWSFCPSLLWNKNHHVYTHSIKAEKNRYSEQNPNSSIWNAVKHETALKKKGQ